MKRVSFFAALSLRRCEHAIPNGVRMWVFLSCRDPGEPRKEDNREDPPHNDCGGACNPDNSLLHRPSSTSLTSETAGLLMLFGPEFESDTNRESVRRSKRPRRGDFEYVRGPLGSTATDEELP